MTYEYTCPKHGQITRSVPVTERDCQVCDCGAKLKRVFPPRASIFVPLSFIDATGDVCGPQNAEEKKHWDECGVTAQKSRWGRGVKVR